MRVRELEAARVGLFIAMSYDYANVAGDTETLKEYVRKWDKGMKQAAFTTIADLAKCASIIAETVKEVEAEERNELWKRIIGDEETGR